MKGRYEIKHFQMPEPMAMNYTHVNISDQLVTSSIYSIDNEHSEIESQKLKTEPHRHDYFELIIVLSGSVIQHIEDKQKKYTAGTCCILNKNVTHHEEYNTDADILFLMLQEEFLNPIVDSNFYYVYSDSMNQSYISIEQLIKENQSARFYTVRKYIEFSPSADILSSTAVLKLHAERLKNAIIGGNPGTLFIIAGLIIFLFSTLESSLFNKEIISLFTSKDEIIAQNVQSILQETNGNVSNDFIAKRLNYSADYINKSVKKTTGLTLTEYRHRFLIHYASQLLNKTNKSVTEIITELGFSNRTYFNKLFVEEFQTTPLAYRKKTSRPS